MSTNASYGLSLPDRITDAERLVRSTHKASVLVIQQFPVVEDAAPLVPPVRESVANILAFIELGTCEQAERALDIAGDRFDIIALDCDQKLPDSRAIVDLVRARVTPAKLMFYSDNQAWFDSALDMIQRIENGVTGRSGLLCGEGVLADQLAWVLPRLGARVVPAGGDVGDVDFVLGASQKRPSVDVHVVEAMSDRAAIYDLGIGNLAVSAAARARERGLRLYRLDNRAGVSSAIVRLLETDYMVQRLMGHMRIRDVDVVAGGLLAPPGAVVVDDIKNPTVVFGVADGAGRFRGAPLSRADQANIDFVKSLMVKVQ